MADTFPEWSAGSNKMGERIFTKNWHNSSLGSIEDWPQNLGLALDICLGANLSASICWGPELIFFYNDAWRDLLGDKHPSALGRPATEVFSEVREEVEPVFEQVLGTGEAAEFPGRLLRKSQNGSDAESYFDVTVNPIPGKGGSVAGTFNIATRKEFKKEKEQAYDQLSKSEEKYRSLIESMDEGFCIIEMLFDEDNNPVDYRFLETNPSFEKQTGIKNADGKRMRQIAPDHEDYWFEIYGKVALTREPVRFELPAEALNHFYDVYAFPFGEPESRKVAVLFNDISQRKQTEEELHKLNKELEERVERRTAKLKTSRDRLRIALEAADLGMWDLDLAVDSASIRSVRHDQIFGYEKPQEEWGQEIALNHVLPEDREIFKQAFSQARETGILSFQVRVKWPDDNIHWIEALGKTYYNSEEQPVRMAGVVKDITGQKEAEEARLYYQKQLRSLASELSKAEERERHRLAAELHDNLGQILAVTKMNLVNIEKNDDIVGEVTKVTDLVDDALAYTRDLMMELKPPPSLNKEGIVEVLEWVAKKMEKHGLLVSIEDPEQLKPLSEEVRTTLYECVRELLFNVVKHAGVNEARVDLSYSDNQLLIIVEDKGRGFNPEEKEMVPAEEGRFGLFKIRERMNWLGGSLEIISEPGKGTKAMLYAPVKDKEEESNQSDVVGSGVKESRTAGRPEEQKESQQKIRILLVDDHQMVRRGLRNIIEAQDDLVIIAEAADGHEAVELARETSPEVIVMDVNMPRMDGIEATRKISSDFPQIRIIGLSLHKKEDVAHSMQSAGAFAYLTKDQAFETLCSTIRRAAGGSDEA